MADETPTLDLAELERLEKAATPPGWRVEDGSTAIWSDNAYDPATNNVGCIVARTSNPPTWKASRPTHDETIANAHLIAALRNAAPALIAAAKERDDLRAERDTTITNHHDAMADERADQAAELRGLRTRLVETEQSFAQYKRGNAMLRDDNASLRALLIRAGSAMKPMSAMLCLVDDKDPSKGRAFDRFADDAVLFNVGKDRTITAGDLRRAFEISAALDARISALTSDTTDAGERDA